MQYKRKDCSEHMIIVAILKSPRLIMELDSLGDLNQTRKLMRYDVYTISKYKCSVLEVTVFA